MSTEGDNGCQTTMSVVMQASVLAFNLMLINPALQALWPERFFQADNYTGTAIFVSCSKLTESDQD